MIPKLSAAKVIKYRAALRIVVFIAFLVMAYWFAPNKAIYLAAPICIGLAVSVLQFRSASGVHDLMQSVGQLKGFKKALVLCLACGVAIITIYSVWMLIRLAN
jgi:hypothetical protein